METEAAILWGMGQDWKVETIELDPPKTGEVLVRIAASGMCHSDEHMRTGDLGGIYPVIGGHEGAGVVEEVGPGVEGLNPGDHVVFGFVPACGKCPSCAAGPLQPLRRGGRADDGSPGRRHPPPPRRRWRRTSQPWSASEHSPSTPS